MKFYVSGVEKAVYRKAIEAESAEEAVEKFKDMIEEELIEEADTYIDEIMCRGENQEFPEIYEGGDEESDEEGNEENYNDHYEESDGDKYEKNYEKNYESINNENIKENNEKTKSFY